MTLTEAAAWGQPIQNLSVQFQAGEDTLQSALQLQSPAGSGAGKLSYDFRSQKYEAQFSLAGVQLARLEVLHRGSIQVTGVAAAHLEGQEH